MSKPFEPRILGFLCNWCCYAAADAAGVARYQYPPNIRVIRVMCSGRIDPCFVFEGFLQGADGIFTGGCQLGDCHYQLGNYEAVGVFELTWHLMEAIGLSRDRLTLQWASAAEAPQFVQLVTAFTKGVAELGPLGSSEGFDSQELAVRLNAAKAAAGGRKLRLDFGKTAKKLRQEMAFKPDQIAAGVKEGLPDLVRSEVARADVIERLSAFGPQETAALAEACRISPESCQEKLDALAKRGRVVSEGNLWRLAPEPEAKAS
jgi:coenzyme F420-reducing hydrogenase delta subunit